MIQLRICVWVVFFLVASWFPTAKVQAFQRASGGRIAVRWVGQDGHDYVGPHSRLEPSEIQDVHLVVDGIDPAREIERVELSAEGDRWVFPSNEAFWRLGLARRPQARTVDVFFEPNRVETGRVFHLVVCYRDGASAETEFRSRRVDPRLRAPMKTVTGRFLGQDHQDWIGRYPRVGPDGLVDAHIRLTNLGVRRIEAVRIEASSKEIWEFGVNPELRAPAELLRGKDPNQADLYFQPVRDLAGRKLQLTIVYEGGRSQKVVVPAGRVDPRLAMPARPIPGVVELELGSRWLGQDGTGGQPGDVHVAITGLPAGSYRAALLTNRTRCAWVDRRDAGFQVPSSPITRPLRWRQGSAPGTADLHFEPMRDETGSELHLTLFLSDGRVATGRIPGGACDLGLACPRPAATIVQARAGDDLQALADRGGTIALAPGVYRLSRTLELRQPTALIASQGAELRFSQGAQEPPWSAAIKIHAGSTTLEGFKVRFDGPVRWNHDVSWGPAVIGMADNFDRAPDLIPGVMTFRKLDLEQPAAADPGGWVEALRLIRLVHAGQGVIEGNVLRGGTIEFFGGPWRIVNNVSLGTPVGTASHGVFAGHGVHDVLVSGNRTRASGPSGKTWRFLVFSGAGAYDKVTGNVLEGLGAREGDTVPWSNEPEIMLTEAYQLKYEGVALGVSTEGRVIRLGQPQGNRVETGDLLAILSGPGAGEFREVVLAIDPTTILVDRRVSRQIEAVSIATGFLREEFSDNQIDLRGGVRSDGLVLVGNHFGTIVAHNRFLGGGHAFRLTACPTEAPIVWGWSHAPFLEGIIRQNIIEDTASGGVIGLEHDLKYVRSKTGRRYMSVTLEENIVRWSQSFLSTRPAEPALTAGLTLGYHPVDDPGELEVKARGNRLEAPANRPRAVPLLVHGALYNSQRIVNRKLDLTAVESARGVESKRRSSALR